MIEVYSEVNKMIVVYSEVNKLYDESIVPENIIKLNVINI